jgi:hypothetical protein
VKRFLADFDPNSKALADYNDAASLLLEMFDSGTQQLETDEQHQPNPA